MSGLFDHKYPTTNLHELDLSWIITKVKELNERIDNFETDLHDRLIAETEAYVDQSMAGVRADFATLVAEVNRFETEVNGRFANLSNEFDTFKDAVNIQLNLMYRRIDEFEDEINAAVIGVNAYTDAKIEANNEYILELIAEGLINVKVLNYFTGEYVVIQDMFNYLAELHLENPITYTELAAAAIDYDTLAGYNMTYTELAVKGKSFINP